MRLCLPNRYDKELYGTCWTRIISCFVHQNLHQRDGFQIYFFVNPNVAFMQGLMTDEDRDTILIGIDEIEKRIDDGKFNWRADREDVHMNVEAALIELVGEPAKKLHTARSRNDQVRMFALTLR